MIISHGTLVLFDPANQIIRDGALRIEGGVITRLGATKDLVTAFPDDEILDARGHLVLPGNICSHTHFYGTFARGMALGGEPPRNFVEILEKLWWRLDKALDLEDVRYSTLPALVDAIRNGGAAPDVLFPSWARSDSGSVSGARCRARRRSTRRRRAIIATNVVSAPIEAS